MTEGTHTLHEWLELSRNTEPSAVIGLLDGILRGLEVMAPSLIPTPIAAPMFVKLLAAAHAISDVLDEIFRLRTLKQDMGRDKLS